VEQLGVVALILTLSGVFLHGGARLVVRRKRKGTK